MAWGIKHLPCRHEGWSSGPRNPHRSLAEQWRPVVSVLGRQRHGVRGTDWLVGEAGWPPYSVRDPASINKGERCWLRQLACNTCTHTYTCKHSNAHIHKIMLNIMTIVSEYLVSEQNSSIFININVLINVNVNNVLYMNIFSIPYIEFDVQHVFIE